MTARYAAPALLAFNLLLFIFAADQVFDHVHHHWVLPASTGAFLIELALLRLAGRTYPEFTSAARRALPWLAGAFCLIGAARYETIFACVERCGWKLGAMFALAALIFFVERRKNTGLVFSALSFGVFLFSYWHYF